jgi:hypothetical protein
MAFAWQHVLWEEQSYIQSLEILKTKQSKAERREKIIVKNRGKDRLLLKRERKKETKDKEKERGGEKSS